MSNTPCSRIVNCKEVGGNTILVDPNPFNETVEHEDLNIYVNLRAKLRGRSVLIKGDPDIINVGFSQIKTEEINNNIDFLQPKGKQYLTTDWSTIGGVREEGVDYETFGITNINIDIKASFVPKVVIDFVDIRGATLFEQGPCSPYSAFFHLPYPVFELTLKGYYGKPIKYFLHLTKFNTRFNPQTGNYESRGEFIGYTFAFISDILMGYIAAAGYMEGSTEELKSIYEKYLDFLSTKKGISLNELKGLNPLTDGKDPETNEIGSPMRIRDLWIAIDELEKIQSKLSQTKELKEISVLDSLSPQIADIKTNLIDFEKEWVENGGKIINEDGSKIAIYRQETINGQKSNESINKLRDLRNTFNLYFLNTQNNSGGGIIEDSVELYNSTVEKVKAESNTSILKFNKEVLPSQLREQNLTSLVKAGLSVIDENTYEEAKDISVFGGNALVLGTIFKLYEITEEVYNQYTVNKNSANLNFVYVDLTKINNEVERVLTSLNSEIKKITDIFNNKSNKAVEEAVGFLPTILNIFIVLLGNTELFLKLLLKATEAAETYHQNNPETAIDVDRDNNGKLYAWPTYKITKDDEGNVEDYPGNNALLENWPEVKFVEDFLEALIKLSRDKRKFENDEEEIVVEGQPGYDNYIPINSFETPIVGGNLTANGYLGKTEADDIVSEIGKRFLILTNHTFMNTDDLLLNSPLISNLNKIDRVDSTQVPWKLSIEPPSHLNTYVYKYLNSNDPFLINKKYDFDGIDKFTKQNDGLLDDFLDTVTPNKIKNLEILKSFGKTEAINFVNTVQNRELISRLQVLFENPEEAKEEIIKILGLKRGSTTDIRTSKNENIYLYEGELKLNESTDKPIVIKANPHEMDPEHLVDLKEVIPNEIEEFRRINITDETLDDYIEEFNEEYFKFDIGDGDGEYDLKNSSGKQANKIEYNYYASNGFKFFGSYNNIQLPFISITQGVGDGLKGEETIPTANPFAPYEDDSAPGRTTLNRLDISTLPISHDLDLAYKLDDLKVQL